MLTAEYLAQPQQLFSTVTKSDTHLLTLTLGKRKTYVSALPDEISEQLCNAERVKTALARAADRALTLGAGRHVNRGTPRGSAERPTDPGAQPGGHK